MKAARRIREWFSKRFRIDAGALGRLGERCAARYLARNGLEILAANVRLSGVEIDLVARQGQTLVFVEVKSTSEGSWCEGFERIDAYLARLEREPESYRLDAVSVRFSARSFWPRVRRIYWEKGLFPIDE